MMKNYYIETFGCQMNKSDSELMKVSLDKSGFNESRNKDDADIILFNTCSVRQHAEDRAISVIKSFRNQHSKKDNIIVVTGCMAQRIGKKLINENIADLIVGPFQSPKIGEIINVFMDDQKRNVYLSQEKKDFANRIDQLLAFSRDTLFWHKWVTITHGCDNFCSYCIVPYVRGPLISFPSDIIISYLKVLASNGIKEITLLGQNVNQYGMDIGDIPFHKLLERVAGISEFEKINFLTSHPRDFDDNIIYVIRDNKNISKSIHLPLQSGSDKILKLMKRDYTVQDYMDIIDKIHKNLDNISISTDLIVGFHGETGNDFNHTLQMVERIKFNEAFMYAYSPREGTFAYDMKDTVPKSEKLDRLNTLIGVQRGFSREKLSSRIDSIEEMIIERISKKSKYEVMGKTFLNHPVIVSGNTDDIGKKIKIKITGLKGSTLYGKKIE